jgi:hypothetical protein
MEVLHAHCAGLDIHKDSVVACVRHMVEGKVTSQVKTFKTTTQELMALSDWLSAEGVTHIGMEATGVYWKPVWHILSDGEFELVLANAVHVKNVPGSKTDVNDATWLADLMAHGLIRPSFVPDEPTQQMRDAIARIDKEVDCKRRTLSRSHRNAENHSRRQPPRGRGDRVGDRYRYEPVPNGRRSDFLGRTLPQERRKRWKTPLHAHEKGCPLAQDHSGPMRMGGHAHQANLPPRSIPAHSIPPRRQEGHRCCRRFHPHCRLPHAQKWHPLPGHRRKPLRQTRPRQARLATREPLKEPRFRRPDRERYVNPILRRAVRARNLGE